MFELAGDVCVCVSDLAFVVLLSVALAPLQTNISMPVSIRNTKLQQRRGRENLVE